MRWILLCASLVAAVFLLSGCKDTYRYPCQNPDNFYAKECQKPKCQFTQQCPEYLVAPILEKQTNVQPAASEASSVR
jgi:hypothetical protein